MKQKEKLKINIEQLAAAERGINIVCPQEKVIGCLLDNSNISHFSLKEDLCRSYFHNVNFVPFNRNHLKTTVGYFYLT